MILLRRRRHRGRGQWRPRRSRGIDGAGVRNDDIERARSSGRPTPHLVHEMVSPEGLISDDQILTHNPPPPLGLGPVLPAGPLEAGRHDRLRPMKGCGRPSGRSYICSGTAVRKPVKHTVKSERGRPTFPPSACCTRAQLRVDAVAQPHRSTVSSLCLRRVDVKRASHAGLKPANWKPLLTSFQSRYVAPG